MSNNESEYEALIVALKKAKLLGVQNLVIYHDSQLVTNQIIGKYTVRNHIMKTYMRLIYKLFRSFNLAYIERLPQTSNSHADASATLSSAVESDMKRTMRWNSCQDQASRPINIAIWFFILKPIWEFLG